MASPTFVFKFWLPSTILLNIPSSLISGVSIVLIALGSGTSIPNFLARALASAVILLCFICSLRNCSVLPAGSSAPESILFSKSAKLSFAWSVTSVGLKVSGVALNLLAV